MIPISEQPHESALRYRQGTNTAYLIDDGYRIAHQASHPNPEIASRKKYPGRQKHQLLTDGGSPVEGREPTRRISVADLGPNEVLYQEEGRVVSVEEMVEILEENTR